MKWSVLLTLFLINKKTKNTAAKIMNFRKLIFDSMIEYILNNSYTKTAICSK